MTDPCVVYVCDFCDYEEIVTEDNFDGRWTDITFNPVQKEDKHYHLELCKSCMAALTTFTEIYKKNV